MSHRARKETRLTISLEADAHRELEEIARKSDVSLAWVIRRAISDFLQKNNGDTLGQLPLQLQADKVA